MLSAVTGGSDAQPCAPSLVTSPGGTGTGNSFGSTVAISGNSVFISDASTGTVWVYALVAQGFSTPYTLSNTSERFGESSDAYAHPNPCAPFSNYYLLGDPGDDSYDTDFGKVYVGHSQDVGNCSQYLSEISPPLELLDSTAPLYGASVGIDGGWMVIGAPGADATGTDNDQGAAYVDVGRTHTSAFNLGSLVTLDPNARFGQQVCIVNNGGGDPMRIAVTAPGQQTIYLFQRSGSTWIADGTIEPGIGNFTGFLDLSVSGTIDDAVLGVVVGTFSGEDFYAAKLYHFDGAQWTEEMAISGIKVEVDGDRAIVTGFNGAASQWTRTTGQWSMTRVMNPGGLGGIPDSQGDYIVVGDKHLSSQDGVVYVYDAPAQDCNFNCIDDLQELGADCNNDNFLDLCQSSQWNATSGSFDDPLNWSGLQVPEAHATLSNALVATTATCTLSQPFALCSINLAGDAITTDTQSLFSQLLATDILDVDDLDIDAYGVLSGSGIIGNIATNTTNGGTIESTGALLTLRANNLENEAMGAVQAGVIQTLSSDIKIEAASFDQNGTLAISSGRSVEIGAGTTNAGRLALADGAQLVAPSGFVNTGNSAFPPLQGVFMDGGSITLGAQPNSRVTNDGLLRGFGFISYTGSGTPTLHNTSTGIVAVTNSPLVGSEALSVQGDVLNEGIVFIASDDVLAVSSFSGTGAIGGGTCAGCKEEAIDPFGTLRASVSISLSPAATVKIPQGTIACEGNVDLAVDDPARFDMSTATVQLDGFFLFGTQEFSLLSAESGSQLLRYDPPPYLIGSFRVGPNPAAVKLVDPSASGRVLYVDELVLDPSTTLDLAGTTVYYASIQADDLQSQVTDSVGGGQLVQYDLVVGVEGAEDAIAETRMFGSYPNPFGATTTFSFGLASPEAVQLTLFDVRGRLVRAIRPGVLPAGRHALRWDGTDAHGSEVSAGVYFYRLRAGSYEHVARLIRVR